MWHDESYILGDRSGLLALRNAIDDAMSNHVATSSNVFTSDGEGYRIRLMVVDLETLEKLRMPYTDTEHCDYGGNHASTLFVGLP